MNSQEKAKDFLELLKKREQLQSELTELNKQITQKSQELYDMMEDENVDSIEIEGIKFEPVVEQDFVLTGELAGKKWDDVTEWFQWLKEIGEDGLMCPGILAKNSLKIGSMMESHFHHLLKRHFFLL